MKTKTITLYNLNELSKEAQKKAHRDWISHNDYPFLTENLTERLKEQMEKYELKSTNPKVSYSLSNSQGDGAMFYGDFDWGKYTVFIKQSGRYAHSNSKTYEIHETDNLGIDIAEDYEPKVYTEFEYIYQQICKELETFGYTLIEDDDSLEAFKEACEANQYTFLADGKMEN